MKSSEKKLKKQVRRQERQEEWKQTASIDQIKEIGSRVTAGVARATARKEREKTAKEARLAAAATLQVARDRRLEAHKPGREFNATNKTMLFKGTIFGLPVVAGALLRTGTGRSVYYAVAYAICSPRDRFSQREGCDRVGMRLLEGGHPYSFEINLSKRGALSPVRLAMLIHAHIVMDVVSRRVRLPEKMERMARKWTRRAWCWDNRFTPIEGKKDARTLLGKARQV